MGMGGKGRWAILVGGEKGVSGGFSFDYLRIEGGVVLQSAGWFSERVFICVGGVRAGDRLTDRRALL